MEHSTISFSNLFLSQKYIILFLGNIVSGVAIVVFNLLLANTFSQDEFGILIFVISISIISSQLIIFGSTGFFLNQFGLKNHNQAILHEQFLSYLLLNFFLLLCLSFLFTFLFNEQISFLLQMIFVTYVVAQVFLEINILITQITNNFFKQSIILFIPHLLRIIAITTSIFLFDISSFNTILIFILLANLLSIFILFFQNIDRISRFIKRAFKSILKNYLSFLKSIKGFGIYELLFLSYTQVPLIFLGILFNFDKVAIYSIVITISTIFILPSGVFTKAYHPLLQQNANKGNKAHKATVLKFLKSMLLLGLIMGTLSLVLGSLMPIFFLDESYSTSSDLIKIMSIFIFIRYLNAAISSSFYLKDYINMMAFFMFIIIIIQFIFIYILFVFGIFNLFYLTYLSIALEGMFFIICACYLYKRILN